MCEVWRKVVDDINSVQHVTMSRQVNTDAESSLHAFCDASGVAYGVVVYLKCGNSIQFVMAKAKIIPVKSPSLPQM